MLLSDFIRDGAARLENLYPSPEARGLVLMLCRELLGVTNYTHIVEPQTAVPAEREAELCDALARLCAGEPIQYVLGFTEFCDRRFAVGPGVLIPRPETEQLVAEAVRTLREMDLEHPPRVLDLCTGSGCIAWSMALALPGARVTGVDVSEEALAVARGQKFSQALRRSGARAPEFIRMDILDPAVSLPEGAFDLVLSNPPYILESQKAGMRRNVLDFEPHLALFVPDEDPLLFYRAIARISRRCLAPWGRGFAEINEDLGPQTCALFVAEGFGRAAVRKDFYGKNRLISY